MKKFMIMAAAAMFTAFPAVADDDDDNIDPFADVPGATSMTTSDMAVGGAIAASLAVIAIAGASGSSSSTTSSGSN